MASILDNPDFIPFVLRAKRSTYAAGDAGQVVSSRKASKDLAYQEGELAYLDTYLGGYAFIGEEAVWLGNVPLWGMNYYGTMTAPEIPEGFSHFLKQSLLRVPAEAPYRGPAEFAEGHFTYTCHWQGDPSAFAGDETIAFDGRVIYRLRFHGGVII